jgi:hypothetical protein
MTLCPVVVIMAADTVDHSFKNWTSDRTGDVVGSDFYWSDHWFTGSMSGFLRYKLIYFYL